MKVCFNNSSVNNFIDTIDKHGLNHRQFLKQKKSQNSTLESLLDYDDSVTLTPVEQTKFKFTLDLTYIFKNRQKIDEKYVFFLVNTFSTFFLICFLNVNYS
jgi:UDP-3-O-acyl-N-acetylglucosamine deacetylase